MPAAGVAHAAPAAPVHAFLGPVPAAAGSQPASAPAAAAPQTIPVPGTPPVAVRAVIPPVEVTPPAPVVPLGPPPSPEEFFGTAPAAAVAATPRLRAAEQPITPRELHARVAPAIVALVVGGGSGPPTVVTGTMVTASGLTITSRSAIAAAIDGGATLAVVRGGGNVRLPARALNEAVRARVVALSDDLDVAVVEAMPREPVFYPHLPLVRRPAPDGVALLAVGHAGKRGLWAGALTTLGPAPGRTGVTRWLRTTPPDAALESGTALVDSLGRIVAMSTSRGTVDADGLLRFLLAADAPNLRFAGVTPAHRPVPGMSVAGHGGDTGPAVNDVALADAMPGIARKGVLDRRFSVSGDSAATATVPAAKASARGRGPAHVAFGSEDGDPVRLTLADLERHAASATLRVETRDAPVRGAATAPVTIVEFGDFHSPETRQLESTVRGLVEGDGAPARLMWKDADRGDGPDYHMAARAARAAHEQDEFWDMHDRLLRGGADPNMDKARKLAHELELDERQFTASLLSPGSAGAADAEAQRAGKLPVLCTPAFVVNGQIVEGGSIAGPVLQSVVDDEVAAHLGGPAGRRPARAISGGGPINGPSFDPAKMARVAVDATRRAQGGGKR